MTDQEAQELNERVARAMGWHFREDPEQATESYWTLPDGGMDDAPPFGTPHTGHYGDFYTLPDFARDPMALGYLVGYLARTETPFRLDGSERDDGPGPLDFHATLHGFRRSSGFCATPGEALARVIVRYSALLEAE